MLDTRSLRHFVAVAQELHFGRAARRLNISQPPLSVSIRQLEERLQARLFKRTQRSVQLTAAGAVLLRHALQILEQMEQAEAMTHAAARGHHELLRIGYTAATAYAVIPRVMGAFHRAYPLVELVLHEMVSTEQLLALRQQQLDIGVLRPTQLASPLKTACVMREPLVLALHSAHPLATRKRVRLESLQDLPFIAFRHETAPYFHGMVDELLKRAGVRPRIVQRATQTHALAALAAAGLGVAVVPQTCERIHIEGLVFRPFSDVGLPRAEIHVCWNSRHDLPLIDRFADTAVQAMRDRRQAKKPGFSLLGVGGVKDVDR